MNPQELAKRIRLPLPIIQEVDHFYNSLPKIKCKGLCHDSCSPIGDMIMAFERDRILAKTGKLPNMLDTKFVAYVIESVRACAVDTDRPALLQCNLLSADGRCSVHDIRPLICRMWGFTGKMHCPHGCERERELTDEEGYIFFREFRKIAREYTSKLRARSGA